MIKIPTAQIKSAIADVFSSLGEPFTVRTVTSQGSFNPVTGVFDGRVVADRVMTGIDVGHERKYVNGILIVEEGYVIYLFDDGLGVPSPESMIVLDGEETGIKTVEENKLKGTQLAYRVTLVS